MPWLRLLTILFSVIGVLSISFMIWSSRRNIRRFIGKHYVLFFGPKNVGKTTLKLWIEFGRKPTQKEIEDSDAGISVKVPVEGQIFRSIIVDSDGDGGQTHADIDYNLREKKIKILIYMIRLDKIMEDDSAYVEHHKDDLRFLKREIDCNEGKRPWSKAMIVASHADKIGFERKQTAVGALVAELGGRPWFSELWHVLGGRDSVPLVPGSLAEKRDAVKFMYMISKLLKSL